MQYAPGPGGAVFAPCVWSVSFREGEAEVKDPAADGDREGDCEDPAADLDERADLGVEEGIDQDLANSRSIALLGRLDNLAEQFA